MYAQHETTIACFRPTNAPAEAPVPRPAKISAPLAREVSWLPLRPPHVVTGKSVLWTGADLPVARCRNPVAGSPLRNVLAGA